MHNSKLHITPKKLSSKWMCMSVVFLLTVFFNFTIAIQYINWSSFNITTTEIVEEEEIEEHKIDIYEAIINNTNAIKQLCFPFKEEIKELYLTDLLKPPPKIL